MYPFNKKKRRPRLLRALSYTKKEARQRFAMLLDAGAKADFRKPVEYRFLIKKP